MTQKQNRMTDRELEEAWSALTECYSPSAEHSLTERVDRLTRITSRLLTEIRERRMEEASLMRGRVHPQLSVHLQEAIDE